MRVEQSFVDTVTFKANSIVDLAFVKVATGEMLGNQAMVLEIQVRRAMRCVNAALHHPEAIIDAYAYLSSAYDQVSFISDRGLFKQVESLQRYVGSYIKEQIRIQNWKEEEGTNG